MKQCPQCGQTFVDDSLMFCLLDGAQLVVADEGVPTVVTARPGFEAEPTVVMTQPQVYAVQPPPVKKSNKGLWIGFIVVAMMAGIVVVAGVLMLFFGNKGEIAAGTQKNGVNSAATPKPSATPKAATPTVSPTPSPTPVKGSATPDGNGEDEITPIAWTTSAAAFKTDPGQKYKFHCPESGVAEMVWGSDVYTADSSICTAAVHAGLITLEDGGDITLEFKPGRSIYGSTTRNGITTNTFGEQEHSFVVR